MNVPKTIRQRQGQTWKRSHIRAHAASDYHGDQIRASRLCGCFGCLLIFRPHRLHRYHWVNQRVGGQGVTATCPRCDIDSVIGSASGFPITKAFLRRMQKYWLR